MFVNGLAENMSRVGCINNPRSVPRRGKTSTAYFWGIYDFKGEILSARHQAQVSYDLE